MSNKLSIASTMLFVCVGGNCNVLLSMYVGLAMEVYLEILMWWSEMLITVVGCGWIMLVWCGTCGSVLCKFRR